MTATPQMPMTKPATMMNDNAKTVREFLIALDRKQGVPTEFLAKDLRFVFNGDQPTDAAGWKKLAEFWFGAFPGSKHKVDYAVSEGDRVYARLRATGLHNGPFGAMPATKKPIDIVGASCFEFRDGKIVRVEAVWDMLTCMKQIGAIPS